MPWQQLFVLQEVDCEMDQLREEQHLASLLGDSARKHLDHVSAEARRQLDAIDARLRFQQQRRDSVLELLPHPVVAQYLRLRARYKSRPWVITLGGDACTACNIVLPSGLMGAARRTGAPVACPWCARLLVWRSATR